MNLRPSRGHRVLGLHKSRSLHRHILEELLLETFILSLHGCAMCLNHRQKNIGLETFVGFQISALPAKILEQWLSVT